MLKNPFNETTYNVGNSIFPGFNDKEGIILCGYEYGYSAHDQYLENYHKDEIEKKKQEINTFYSKSKIYTSPYDFRIVKWFSFFSHPLGIDNGFSSFDKCLLQTNWCDDQGTYVNDYAKFLSEANCRNFLSTMDVFRPRILFFMGSKQIQYLQKPAIKNRFSEIFGEEVSRLDVKLKPFEGRKFKIAFQMFERVQIISFPHPSGTRGLSDNYIKLFSSETKEILDNYRALRRF
ncbi:hypothetical protein [Thiocystis violacea]|uniref:hypothetical protein n=1 Tax=Thiocystis violacea TaxID=13725 RepID=UPI001906C732|nr:hypothetical protein [Thiocystis violacea]